MEVDILADGTLDLPDDALARLDLVIVSAHSALRMERARMTERVIRAISHPAVRVLGHATGRLIGRREPSLIDLDAVFAAAAAHGVAVELNAQPHRLDVNDVQVRRAREHGVLISIGTDAHSTSSLDFMRGGVDQARRGWLEPSDVVNAMEPDRFNAWLARRSDVVRTQRRAQIAEGELL
jgi:DNA polymerase (family 10)